MAAEQQSSRAAAIANHTPADKLSRCLTAMVAETHPPAQPSHGCCSSAVLQAALPSVVTHSGHRCPETTPGPSGPAVEFQPTSSGPLQLQFQWLAVGWGACRFVGPPGRRGSPTLNTDHGRETDAPHRGPRPARVSRVAPVSPRQLITITPYYYIRIPTWELVHLATCHPVQAREILLCGVF